jgi:hypothetical protein
MSRPFRNRCTLSAITAGLLLATSAALAFIVQTIPVHISTSTSSVAGSAGFDCKVTVQIAPTEDSVVLVNTNRPDLLHSPSGTWPYALAIPARSTQATFKVQTAVVESPQSASIASYEAQQEESSPGVSVVATSVQLNP